MHQNNQRLCFVAGRSGGHLVPALTLALEHKKQFPHASLTFITTDTSLDKKIMSDHETIDHTYHVRLDNIPGMKQWYRYPSFIFRLIRACVQSMRILYTHKPHKIICTGGYIALPVCIAATLLRIPIQLYELNALPGKAVKTLAPLAQTVACCFQDACRYFPAPKTKIAAYPIRFQNSTGNSQEWPPNFCSQRKTILVIGGSQGSQFINTFIGQWLAVTHLKNNIQIIHQTGIAHLASCKAMYAQYAIPAQVFDYSSALEQYYQLADIVVCRSGAGSLFETLFFKKPCITIPLQTPATDHQVYNAQAIAKEHPALFTVMMQKELEKNPSLFEECVQKVFRQSVASHAP